MSCVSFFFYFFCILLRKFYARKYLIHLVCSPVFSLIYEFINCHRCLCLFWIVLFRYCTTAVQYYYCMYKLLDPVNKTKVQLFDFTRYVFLIISPPSLSVDVALRASLELCPEDIELQYYTPGWMQADCGWWIRWLVSRIRSSADKLGRGREIYTVWQRTVKRNDDDGDSKDVGLSVIRLRLGRRLITLILVGPTD